jgi:NADH-quinone oxidoreductase subunit L
MEILIKLIVGLPLLSALMIGLRTRTCSDRFAQVCSSSFLVAAAVFSAVVFGQLVSGHEPFKVHVLRWIASGDFKADWVLRVDMLTAVMLVVVTWVSAVVHIYSIGYMSHDDHKPRFMAYLSLFTFCMLMLVTADNLVQLFFGWEGVGLSSYLLIGFWYHKESANAASMKAFIVNRVGDVGLAMGIALAFYAFGTVAFDDIFAQLQSYETDAFAFLGVHWRLLDLIGLLLFVGCMGKSAQFLLHTWLPDAMEGPTPVSALIHAATMVTAGVFLLARFSPLYELAPLALQVITVVGSFTAIFAATVGLVQNDIKRVIAYSTCSQLGYMFFACGVGAYAAAIFHLMTHAFFKALLFLCAGSVIHAMSDEQDMLRMGGIRKLVPITYGFMWIGSLALAGIPPFAGYFSKDLIIEAAYAADGGAARFAFWMGVSAAFLTAFYSGRLLFMTFHGSCRSSEEVLHHVHEAPKIMWLPLVLLVAGAVLSGWLGSKMGMVAPDGDFWKGAVITGGEHGILHHAHHVPSWVMALPLVLAVGGLVLAYLFYVKAPSIPAALSVAFMRVYQFLLNKWYIDELYDALFVRPSLWIGKVFWKKGDEGTINRFGADGISVASLSGGKLLSALQNGFLYDYAFVMVLGVTFLLAWFVAAGLGVTLW